MASILEGGQLGRYEILEQIGRGGMATVYKARDPALNRIVAVKVLSFVRNDDASFLERFTNEAQAIARLNHPNILQVYDIGEDKGFTFIVTEFVPGGTLHDITGEPLSLTEALLILRPLAEALDYAHANGIIHRDIKPSNVLLRDESEPILADFGLSRAMEQVYRMTASQEVLGTPEYMSPEQALGRDIDQRSDLYAFGIMAYQLLVGNVPYHANTPAATMMAHVHQPLPLPDSSNIDLDPGIKAILLKATAKNPDDRYPTATEIVTALTAITYETPVPVQTVDSLPTTVVVPVVESIAEVEEADELAGQEQEAAETVKVTLWTNKRFLYPVASVALVGAVVIVAVAVFIFGTNDDPNAVPSPEPALANSNGINGDFFNGSNGALLSVSTPTVPLAEALASYNDIKTLIQRRVFSLRGLYPVADIQIDFATGQLRDELADTYFKRRFPRQQVFETEELYKTLGLMKPEENLEEITKEIFMQQIFALFDDDSGLLYVLSDSSTIGPAEELAFASVFMAGLQEQLFLASDLRREARERDNFDSYRALTSFISGEVAQIQQGYVQQPFFDQIGLNNALDTFDDNKLATAPNIVRKAVTFPRTEGSNFVAAIYADKGHWHGVNDVYSDAPISTEQIIHPEKYISGEQPSLVELPDFVATLGRGWEVISEDTLGEFFIRSYLEENLMESEASDAAAGWGGDRYSLLIGPKGERIFLLLIDWDTEADQMEFAQAYTNFLNIQSEGAAFTRSIGNEIWWITPERATLLISNGKTSLVAIADDEFLISQVSSAVPTP